MSYLVFLWSLDYPFSAWYSGPLIHGIACKTDISEEVRSHQSNVISRLYVVLDSFAVINLMSYLVFLWSLDYPLTNSRTTNSIAFKLHPINQTVTNGHKSRCSELISGTKALQFVTFWKFLSLTENAGEHRSKGIDHIYGVQNLMVPVVPDHDFS